jgi:hypothetical protein
MFEYRKNSRRARFVVKSAARIATAVTIITATSGMSARGPGSDVIPDAASTEAKRHGITALFREVFGRRQPSGNCLTAHHAGHRRRKRVQFRIECGRGRGVTFH